MSGSKTGNNSADAPSAEAFRAWLKEYKAYDLASSPTPFRLVSLKTTDKLWDAVRTMLTKHVSSVAVFDEKKANFVGFVDILDVAAIVFALNFANELAGALGKEPSWEKFAQTELKVLSKSVVEDIVNISERDPWRNVAFQASASDLLQALAAPRGARRVAVRDAGNAGIERVVSQWDAVRWLERQLIHQHWFATTPFAYIVPSAMREAHYGRKIHTISASAPTMDAFSKLSEEKVSGLAVVDSHGVLVGVLSASDFLRTHRDRTLHEWDHFFDDMKEPVSSYLSRRNSYFPGGYSKAPITIDFGRDSVMDVLRKYTANHIHRLFIVDGLNRPVDVWSLSDILELFSRYAGPQVPSGEKKKKKKKKSKAKKDKAKKDEKKGGKKK